MAAIKGPGVVVALNKKSCRKGEPTDGGLFGDASAQIEEVTKSLRDYVDLTGKPAKGKVVIVFDLKANLGDNEEVDLQIQCGVRSTKPVPPRKTTLFLAKDGTVHTTPQQLEMPLYDGLKGVDGGKDEEKGKKQAN